MRISPPQCCSLVPFPNPALPPIACNSSVISRRQPTMGLVRDAARVQHGRGSRHLRLHLRLRSRGRRG
ncbi:hypothetical protein TIFTF001_024694 [Ficus carica]|uniref:Uncharacterized protein n=1 Tax=Ficus carica TaxID=3494 RepID=A0AA88DF01_FICCA|nr:hypothetical protein TIFTF001_024694 [Ficus carica]